MKRADIHNAAMYHQPNEDRFPRAYARAAISSMRCAVLTSLAVAMWFGPPAWAEPPIGAQDPPTVVLFILDDVAEADVEAVPTPHIDALATRGTRYRRAYAYPWCRPTRRAMLLSEWDGRVVGDMCSPSSPSSPALPRYKVALPEAMQALGYRTALFGKAHLGPTELGDFTASPAIQGFHTWRAGIPEDTTACQPGAGNYTQWLRVDDENTTIETAYQTVAQRDAYLEWLEATPNAPQRFVVYSFQACHHPWEIPPPELWPPGYSPPASPTDREKYEAMLMSVDVVVGEIVALHPGAWFVLVGDNGTPEAVAPHPGKAKNSLFERGLRVPLIIAGPGLYEQENHDVVSVVDVFPTIIDSLDFAVDSLEGQSLRPTLSMPPGGAPRGYAFAQSDHHGTRSAVVTKDWKLMQDPQQAWPWGDQAIFNLDSDPDENDPLDPDTQDPVMVAYLRGILKTLLGKAW